MEGRVCEVVKGSACLVVSRREVRGRCEGGWRHLGEGVGRYRQTLMG